MNAKVYLVGLGGGMLVTAALVYPLYLYLPGRFVAGWYAADMRLAWTFGGLALLLLLATGAVAARLSGLKSRGGAALAGAVAGFIAAMLAYIFIISPAGGVWGGQALLARGLQPAADDINFIMLLLDANINVMWWPYLALWASILAAPLLGAVGGLSAGAGGKAGEHLKFLAVPMSVAGLLVASLILIVVMSVFPLLSSIVQKAADKAGYIPPHPIISLFVFPAMTSFFYLLIWQGIAWVAVRKASVGATVRSLSWLVSGFINGVLPAALIILLYLIDSNLFVQFPLFVLLGFLASATIGVLAARTSWALRRLPAPESYHPLPGRWFIYGFLVITGLLTIGSYIGGTGAALNIVLLVVTAIAPLSEYGPNVPLHPSTLTLIDMVRGNYFGPWLVLAKSFLWVLICAGVLSGIAWGVDRLVPRFKRQKQNDMLQ